MKYVQAGTLVLTMIFFAGCGSMMQDMGKGLELNTPKYTNSQYIVTREAKFVISIEAGRVLSRYHLTLEIKDKIKDGAYLEVKFENPQNHNAPFVVAREVLPRESIVTLESPSIGGLESYTDYEAVVYAYTDKSKAQLLEEHRQIVRSYTEEIK